MIEKIINEFKEYVRIHNLTQVEAAEKIGISQEHLSRIFNNKRTPSMTLLRKMENILEEQNDKE